MDLWSCGTVMAELVNRAILFEVSSWAALLERILSVRLAR